MDKLNGKQFEFRNALASPFVLHGFPRHKPGEKLQRLPDAIMGQINAMAVLHAKHTSGGMLRFKTDSKAIALRAELATVSDATNLPLSCSSGFDCYSGSGTAKVFCGNTRPAFGQKTIDKIIANNLARETREWSLYLPLFNGVENIQIGLDPDSKMGRLPPFAYAKPLLFYGSSITQGGCASRPGNAYTHILARRLNADFINLGFSSGGLGEQVIAEYIASLEISAFVMDYDHNAPTVEHLENTHAKFFHIIRARQPELPVIFVSKCDFDADPVVNAKRRNIICRTYSRAITAGDKNVYFVDGETLFGHGNRDACTVDGCHPNDVGFMRMATNMFQTVKGALEKRS